MKREEMLEQLAELMPGVDTSDAIDLQDVLLVESVVPEIGMLMTGAREMERQVILHVTGRQLPDMHDTTIKIAMPTYFGARIGNMLTAILIEEVSPTDPDVAAAVVTKKTASPYI